VSLIAALKINRGERVSLVGAGGKTSLAGLLLKEARSREWTALFTTTTKVLPPQEQGPAFIVAADDELDTAWLCQQMNLYGQLFLAKEWLQEWDVPTAGGPLVTQQKEAKPAAGGRHQKLGGFSPEIVDRLAEELKPDLLVVEADGSRHRPLKAPAPYEPVVPTGTTLVLVMAGLSVLGQPLDERWVHRPERVSKLTGTLPGDRIGASTVAAVLAHSQGGKKAVPSKSRLAVVLTQAIGERRFRGREVARRLHQRGGFERIILTDLDDNQADTEVWFTGSRAISRRGLDPQPYLHAVVLAAGKAQRMGQNKLLLPLAEQPLLTYAVDAAIGSLANEVVVILGAEAESVRQALDTHPVEFLYNQHWQDGQSASLREAAIVLQRRSQGLLFLAGDMPLVPSEHLDRLIERFLAGKDVVWSRSGAVQSIPALFGSATFPALEQLKGDVGGKALAGMYNESSVKVDSPQFLWDIDTPATYERVKRWIENRGDKS
jgi:molybdenum cofactor cytidylyltransferase